MTIRVSIIAGALLAAIAAPAAVQATTIDVRHQWNDVKGNDQRDRVLISNRFANGVGVSVEAKFKPASNESKPYNDIVGNGTEIAASYLLKFADSPFTVETGIALDTSSTATTYKPYVRGGAKLSDALSTTLRFRPYYARTGSGAGDDVDGLQYTWAVNYKVGAFSITNELDYKKQETENGKFLSNGRYDCWENDVKVAYKIDQNWSPYVAVGNVPGSAATNERQTRFRVGVAYNF